MMQGKQNVIFKMNRNHKASVEQGWEETMVFKREIPETYLKSRHRQSWKSVYHHRRSSCRKDAPQIASWLVKLRRTMSVNLSKNGPALTAAYKEVVDEKSNTNW